MTGRRKRPARSPSGAGRRAAGPQEETDGLLAPSLDPAVVARQIVESAARLFRARLAVVYRLDSSSGDLVSAATLVRRRTPSRAPQVLPAGCGMASVALREGRPVATTDLATDPRPAYPPEVLDRLRRSRARAVLAVPLAVQDRRVGALVVVDTAGRVFGPAEIRLARTLGVRAAVALDNASVHGLVGQRLLRLETLTRLNHRISSSLQMDEVLRDISLAAATLMDAAVASFWLADEAGSTLEVKAWSDAAMAADFPRRTARLDEGVVGWVATHRQLLHVPDMLADDRIAAPSWWRAHGLRSFLGVPVLREEEGRLLAILALNGRRPFTLTREDQDLLSSLVAQAATAIRNAQLFAGVEASERALRASEARYRSLVEGSIQGILIHRDGVTLFASTPFARMFGYESPCELIGGDARDLVAPAERPRMEAPALATARRGAVPSRYEVEGRRLDGAPIWLDAQASEILWEGRPATLCTVVDVTERKRAEASLHRQTEQIQQAQKLEDIGQLAGGIAHDFNNILTVVTGRCDLLLRRLSPEQPGRRDVELIRKAAARATLLTHQLLAFSRKQVLRPTLLDVNSIASGLTPMLQRLTGEQVAIVMRLAPDLGRVRADPSQIEQIVLNLAINARDAIAASGELTIETANVVLDAALAAASEGGSAGPHVLLAVTDSGAGMTPEVQARVFEPFFTTKEVGKGVGLGLATVYGIVKQHGGHVVVESAPGRGTTVRVYLPREPDHAPETVHRPPADPEAAPESGGHSGSVARPQSG